MRDIPADEVLWWDEHNDKRNDLKYRSIEDCDELGGRHQDDLHEIDKRQTKSETLLKVIIGILTALVGFVVPLLVAILQAIPQKV